MLLTYDANVLCENSIIYMYKKKLILGAAKFQKYMKVFGVPVKQIIC